MGHFKFELLIPFLEMFKIRYLGKSVMRVSLLSTTHALRVTSAGHKDYYLYCLDSFLQFINDLIL